MSKKKKEWRAEKDRLLSLGLEERRKEYRGSYLALDKIHTWANHDNNTATEEEEPPSFSLARKVSLHRGDITTLEVDAIVNAANSSLLGGGGVDGCIHRAAGHLLYDECHSLNGCDTGKAKITCGYDLPAKYVIHTVGPIARGNVGQSQRDDLESCYKNSLKLVKDNKLRSLAFPCISTGIYGFPNEPAAEIALRTVRDWILSNRDEIDRVIFCVFLETDYEIYNRRMSDFFSPDNDSHEEEEEAKMENDNAQTEGGEEDATQGDKKEDEEMMSQTDEIYEDDVKMESQKQDDIPDAVTFEQVKEKPEKGDPKVDESPAAKEELEEGNNEKEREEEKKEDKGGDQEVTREERGGSPGKKMETGQTDEEGQQRKDPTKSADIREGTSEEAEVHMDVHDADKIEIKSAQENNTTSTKDGQVDKSAQRKE
ncbi:ADP-ribose glycohydrolase MACROD1-like isoform X2 [Myxocyprinus asiaticus]|uniref:ADP-ribose glycohydrolase MACROD1-like isoform X2 n=1 Tax=Myxocyprinus asiaticus TaxID=70543 RepID=UPI0022230C34|nr:ADP-ribose glycohydrolase MACROD1-like isoform X2 [Myxocyprinus asiaticus]